jgi:predicted PurR-regulated permease PerM
MTGKKNSKKSKAGFTQSFLKRSQDTISSLKRRIQALSQKEEALEQQEKDLAQTIRGTKAKEVRVSISVESVIKGTIAIFLLIALVQVLGMIRSTIILFLVALFLASTITPVVDQLQKYRIPRPLGIILVYMLVLGVFVLMFTTLIPVIAEQIQTLALSVRDMIQNLVNGQSADSWVMKQIQPYANQLWESIDQKEIINNLTSTLQDIARNLTNFAGNAIGAILAIFNGIFNLIMVLIVSFFMVANSKHTTDFFHSLFPHKYSGYITEKTTQISKQIGEWVRGQVLLAIAMGVLTFIVFKIIGINYALTLSMVSGISEFIPYLGPIITFASAALIAVNQDPMLVIWLIPAYAIIQFVEGNILVPLIVGRSVGLNPVVVMFALLAGAAIGYQIGEGFFMGLVGMIIAVPIANIIKIFVTDYTDRNKTP